MRSVPTLLLLVLPFTLLAQNAPRQLSDEQLAALGRSMEKSRESSINAQQAAARRQEELRSARQRDVAVSDDDDDWQDEPAPPAPAGGMASVLQAFTGTLASEMAMKQQQDAQQQQFLANVRREAEAVDRQRRREQEAQRLAEERARRERQRQEQQRHEQQHARQIAGTHAATGTGEAVTASRPQSTAGPSATGSVAATANPMAQARQSALQANVAAERKRLEEAREQAAAAERLRVMRSAGDTTRTPQGSATASVSAAASVAPVPKDHGPAKAWCQASNAGTYQCMGPLQNLLSWYPSLDVALSQAGCPGGEGYPPTRGHGGSSFNCGRPLKVNDYRMPIYDPYRGGGRPQLVKMGE